MGARRVGEGGWNLYSNKVFNKTGIVILILVIGMHITRRNRPKSQGIPDFGGNPRCNDITFSKIRHNLAQKKSENEKARDFTSLSMQDGAAILEK